VSALGVIAGTGFYSLDALDSPREVEVATAHGPARAVIGGMHGRETVFLARHGADHSVPPHRVNYLANISALVDLGVTEVLAVNVVGGIGLDSGAIAVVMTEPYSGRLREMLLASADAVGIDVERTGIYAAFEGPRFETRAEIRMAQSLGATVVGMTGVPEVVLAKERGLPYASICLVANPAAGLGPEITIEDVMAVVASGAESVARIIVEAARRLADAR